MFTKEQYPSIFVKVSPQWLYNGCYEDSEYLQNPNFVLKTFVIEELEEGLRLYQTNYHYYQKKQDKHFDSDFEDLKEYQCACNKIDGLIKFIQKQHRVWRYQIPENQQNYLRTLYKNMLLFEMFLQFLLPETSEDLEKLLTKLTYKIKNEQKQQEKIGEYWSVWEGIFTGGKYILGRSLLADNFLLNLYKTTSLHLIPNHLEKIKEALKVKPSHKAFEDLEQNETFNCLQENLALLNQQCKTIEKLLNDFEDKGLKLISVKLSLTAEFWESHTVSHYGSALTSIQQLENLIFNYINRLGIDALLKLSKVTPIKVKEDFNQDFFVLLNLAVKDQSGDVLVRKMPTGPQLEPLKTIKQGRRESLDFYLRPDNVYYKGNHQASREELISRIKNNASWISKNFHKIKKEKFPKFQNFLEYIEKNSLRLQDKEIETWNVALLRKAANKLDEHIIAVKSYITRSGGNY